MQLSIALFTFNFSQLAMTVIQIFIFLCNTIHKDFLTCQQRPFAVDGIKHRLVTSIRFVYGFKKKPLAQPICIIVAVML